MNEASLPVALLVVGEILGGAYAQARRLGDQAGSRQVLLQAQQLLGACRRICSSQARSRAEHERAVPVEHNLASKPVALLKGEHPRLTNKCIHGP